MADELDQDSQGQATMFYVKRTEQDTPWHRLGKPLIEAPHDVMEGVKLAGGDYEVRTVPIFIEALNGSGVMTRSQSGRAIIRADRPDDVLDRVFAVRSASYTPLQNWDAAAPIQALIDKGVASLETGGTLRGGRDFWLLVRFSIDDPVVREVFGTEVQPYGLFTNNHSGDAKARIKSTGVRVVCANTLEMAFSDGWETIEVSHRGDAKKRVVEAAEQVFGALVERYQVIAEQYRNLKERILTVEEFTESVLDNAAPLPKKVFTPEGNHLTSRGYDAAYEMAENRRNRILDAWEHGAGHEGDHSAWEAYNGAVEVIDHDSILFRTKGSRIASLIGGRLLERKRAVLNSVAVLAGVPAYRKGR